MAAKIRKKEALDFHSANPPGKIEVRPTKPLSSQHDLALAYSPGVAEPCLEIAEKEQMVYKYTAKGNLVGVISNGTAVLGLGDIGPEASKPVMEGKGVLFKKFAGIDVFDIEINEKDPDKFIEIVQSLEPTFGGINLEDIKAPESFKIERELREKMSIPVMHDDQHGTAIISSAALINALEVIGKKIEKIKIVVSGAGGAACACTDLYISLGARKENILMADSKGIIRSDREKLDPVKAKYATDRKIDSLEEALVGADMFLGLSVADIMTPQMLKSMAKNPIVFALANPNPEIAYELALKTRKDVVMATGRSDHPNQVNNVLGFPYIFRGALDVRSTAINEEMKLAAVKAIATLAKDTVPEMVLKAYGSQGMKFGPEYLIPKPIDPRLITAISPAVARAAIDTGVSRIEIKDWDAYNVELEARIGIDHRLMSRIISRARRDPKKLIFAEADDLTILKAAQMAIDEGIAQPILLGRKNKISRMIKEAELNDLLDCPIIDPDDDKEKREDFASRFFEQRQRKGMTMHLARKAMSSRNFYGSMMMKLGEADALLSGLSSDYPRTILPALQIIGVEEGINRVAGMYIISNSQGNFFFADTTVNRDPSVDELVDIIGLTARAVRFFDAEPRMAGLSYSNFGSAKGQIPDKMSRAVARAKEKWPDLIIDGDIQANAILKEEGDLKLEELIKLALKSIQYSIHERIGEMDFRPATNMSFEEYDRYNDDRIVNDYWREQSIGLDGESAVSGFNFNMQISSNVVGKIGEKLAVTFNYDNNNTFDFQNDLKVEYTGFEEDIIKKIEIGNVSMGPTSNDANDLYTSLRANGAYRDPEGVNALLEANFGMAESRDFVKVTTARKLDLSEYRVNKELGYVTLLRKLQNDEVLAVSFEYTYNGRVYKVGELTEDYQGLSDDQMIYLKMLRPNKINTNVPTWDLMMKNIYNLSTGQINRDGFTLRVHYRDDRTGIDNPSLHEGRLTKDQPLIQLLGLDRLNRNNDRQRDGNFDFIEGITIDTRNGNIIFPVLEPFGKTLKDSFDPRETSLIDKYVYDTLYRTTRADAEQVASLNKYFILGKMSGGSSSDIVLPGINVSEGSVLVLAGNTPLIEGVDYAVDYNLGRVRILNQGVLNSGKNIQIKFEKADLFNFQTRWLTGVQFDYVLNDKFNVGATLLTLNERPGGRTRFNIGDEPTKNTKYGVNVNYQEELPFVTKFLDAMPLLNTKEPSNMTVTAEFAQLVPGTSNIVQGEGTSYIDDFENAITPIGLGGWAAWKLAATPTSPVETFDQSAFSGDELGVNYKRAKLSWYTVDNSVFYRAAGNRRPDNLSESDLENHYVKPIYPQDIFQQQDRTLVTINEPTLDLAFFPSERGQYNYNTSLLGTGRLRDPTENWGGITRAITNEVDFDKTNVEYLEFWLMDPFVGAVNGDPRGRVLDGVFNDNNRTGGELIFNLGSVSEDVMRDGKHAFENGLPADGDVTQAATTDWGYVTNEQYLTDYFENAAGIRENQDVGLDGLDDEQEIEFFQEKFLDRLNVSATARQQIEEDVSADNFNYYLGNSLDNADANIIERYKFYNGLDGNSPVSGGSGGNLTQASTVVPDNEDLNQDNTISTLEEYYEYRLDLRPNQLRVGDGFIVDQVTDRDDVSWYLFRIPIRDPDRIVGDIQGFKSIRYVRTYLTDWEQPVVLRFAKFQLVGSQWRKFTEPLNDIGLNTVPEGSVSDFTVNVVNIEENGAGGPDKVPYTVPPGLNRDRDNTTFLNRRVNEQSLQICIENLEDRDARAVFKNVTYDLINYGRMKMFFHAESFKGDIINDDEVSAFLRFGTDYTENYYEIELPLKITPKGLTLSGDNLRRAVWPEENEIDISINELLGLKSERNRANLNNEIPYSRPSDNGQYKLTVKGRPDISTILTMMIGVRNPESEDRTPKSVCVWANELRVTDFDRRKGWAANARISAKLADLATVTASTRYTSIGFGSIQERISEREREETMQYDISANVNLDKFLLPEKTGLRVPMFASYERIRVVPQFDPLDPDIPLEASLERLSSDEQQDYRQIVEDRTRRRSLNFTNVRKEKVNTEKTAMFYDISNFSVSYAFSDQLTTSVSTETYIQKTQSGGVAYNYSPPGINITPFGSTQAFNSPYLKIIKDINFSPLPSNVSVRADLNRNFTMTQLYNDQLTTLGIDPFYERLFTFNRSYNLRWSIFNALSFDYSAQANAVIDEPDDQIEGDIDTQLEREYIWEQVKDLGRMKNYNQTAGVNYRLPLDKFPITDWVAADVRYEVGYNWIAGSLGQEDSAGNFFGHRIQNSRNRTGTAKLDMVKLYNKVGFLERANAPARPRNPNDEEGGGPGFNPGKTFLRMIMSLRSINLTYGYREGTGLSGFLPTAFLLGMDSTWAAPGVGFLLGDQNPDFRFRAAENGWITQSPFLTAPFDQQASENFSVRASIDPFDDLKIQLDANRTNSANFQEIFRYDPEIDNYGSLTPSRSGNYSISTITIRTAFEKQPKNVSDAFEDFKENIDIIYDRLGFELASQGISGQYDTISQDVLIPAFIAAYSGDNPGNANLRPFPVIPIPNWRMDFAGLNKIPALAEIFSSINLTHSYRSSFNINNYTNSLRYDNNITLDNSFLDYRYGTATDTTSGSLVPVYIMNQVSILEQFTPLLGINVRTKTNMNIRIDYKTDRNLSLNLSNAQVTETRNEDIGLDFGWVKSDLKLPWRVQGRTVTIQNDVTFRVNMTLRDQKTTQRKIDQEDVITNGNVGFQDHEWVSLEGDIATIGITDFAQGELGDIVYVEIETEGMLMNLGLSLSLLIVIVAFEWRSYDDQGLLDLGQVEDDFEDIMEIPPTEQPPPPPPKVQLPEIVEVPDEEEIEEEIEVELDVEVTEETVVEEIVFEEAPEEEEVDEVFTIVEDQPQFPGGMPAFYKFVGDNMKYPAQVSEPDAMKRLKEC
ncbi:maeB [Symbiodinium microadriaticum]|nr:maeB [Symbiodinium microadriaticum]